MFPIPSAVRRALDAYRHGVLVLVVASTGVLSCQKDDDAQAPDACALGCADAGTQDAAAVDAGAADAGAADACASHCADADAANVIRDAAAASGDDAAVHDGDAAVSCAPFPSFRRDCQSDADCRVAVRTYNCCGSQLATGIRADQFPAFAAEAQRCAAQFPRCQCATEATRADDGTVDDYTNSALATAVCREQQCWSSFDAFSGKTPCGAQGPACDAASEICVTTSGSGNRTTTECVPLPPACHSDRTCDCLGADLCSVPATECSPGQFANNVTCACSLCQ